MGKRRSNLWILLQNSSACASTFLAAERRAKLSQHFIHLPPHVRTRRLPYITSSLLERSKAKCCVYECYSPFPTNCDWLKTACLRARLLFQPLCMIIYFWRRSQNSISAGWFSNTRCCRNTPRQGCQSEILRHSTPWSKVFVPTLMFRGK